ncbi:MAG: VOC family protein [Chloroflexi bacterium]|nr:VOC family protein [Chloroflexota bacterium]
MQIEHIAIWTHNLEALKDFYATYFAAVVGNKYRNPNKQFESYFLSFTTGARLELMQRPTIPATKNDLESQFTGYIHLAFAVGSQEQVDQLTERLRHDGYKVADEPRRTGDGYYESVVLDPDGNRIEITI